MPTIPAEVTAIVSDFQTSLIDFKGQVKDALAAVDMTTVAAVLLVIAGAIIIYDLLVYILASTTSARAMMVSPILAKIASQAWERRDELGFSNLIESRSIDDFQPVLEALTMAAEKYDLEEQDLQSADEHVKEE